MKKINIVLSLLMTLFLSVSLIPPVSAQTSTDDIQITYAAGGKETKEVLVKIINNTNRYINITLDHRKESHVYNLSVAPGIVNQYWLYSGPYNINYYAETCGKTVAAHTTFKSGSKLRIGCPGKNYNDP